MNRQRSYCSLSALLVAGMSCVLVAACRSGNQTGNGNSANQNATAAFGKSGDANRDFLLGKWSRVESDGGHYYLFAGDGFTATFDNPKKADRFEFPLPMRGGADRFMGVWSVTDSELVFKEVSGPGVEKPIAEVRVSLKVLDGDGGIEIDGKQYKRGNFDDIVRPDDGDDDVDEDEDEDEDDSE